MFLLTEGIPVSAFHEYVYYEGLGFWSDPQTGRTFFYRASSNNLNEPFKPSFICRFDIHEPAPQWQFLGQLDFQCVNFDVSPCGFYLWSMHMLPRSRRASLIQPIFRQINPNTLQYTVFDVTPAELNLGGTRYCEPKFSKLRHTKHAGTLLIIHIKRSWGSIKERIDLIYRMHIDQNLKHVRLEEIQLPELDGVGNFPFSETEFVKRITFGVFEDDHSLFLYQIDYFGDLFLLECGRSGSVGRTAKWTQLTIEGDKFEPLMLLTDRNLALHPSIDPKKWNDTWNRWFAYTNFNIYGDFLCYGHGYKIHLYRLEFRIHEQACRSTQLFSIMIHVRPYNRNLAFLLPDQRQSSTPETLVVWALQGIPWTKISVRKVAPLLQLTYWTAMNLLKKREEEARAASPKEEVIGTVATTSKRSFWSRVGQLFRRCKPSKHGLEGQTRDKREKEWPFQVESSVGSSRITTVMPVLHSADIIELLRRLNKLH